MTIWNVPDTRELDKLVACYEAYFVTEPSLAWYVDTFSSWGVGRSVRLVMLVHEWVLHNRSNNDMGCSANKPVNYLFVADTDARKLIQSWKDEIQKAQDEADKIKV